MVEHATSSWYEKLKEDDPLSQGDLLCGLPILLPIEPLIEPSDDIRSKITLNDVIVLSQSCDLLHAGKISQIQVAPVSTLRDFLKKNKHLNTVERLEQLRKNQIPRYYLLNRNNSPLFHRGFLVVDFGSVQSVKYNTLILFKKKYGTRISLKSPYKEQLSQHFARFYMRVGLPNDIRPFIAPYS
jgi:hypothetical protein